MFEMNNNTKTVQIWLDVGLIPACLKLGFPPISRTVRCKALEVIAISNVMAAWDQNQRYKELYLVKTKLVDQFIARIPFKRTPPQIPNHPIPITKSMKKNSPT